MPEQLTALDATFLELEEADPSAHMHIGAALIFDPHPETGGAPPYDTLVAHLRERLVALPRYHQRLSPQTVGRLRFPEWVDEQDFDVENHVRRAALPSPGGLAELEAWLSDFYGQRLDRAHPLWEIVLLEGLAGGRWALATKTHHCLVDGVGAVDVGYVLLDAEPDPAPGTWRAPRAPAPHERGALERLLSVPFAAARDTAEAIRHPRGLLEHTRAALDVLVHDELVGAPPSSINVPIGLRRRYAAVTLPLAGLKAVRKAHGGTLNDVVLALVAGALRELLLARGDAIPERGLRTMVPVNVRPDADRHAMGNRVSSLFVHLPVAVADPLERYAATRHEAQALKDAAQADGAATIIALAALAPPVLHTMLAQSLFATRLFNITVTNVPGPQQPLYALGARMREVLPLVPLAAEHALGVAVFSYDGAMTFGVIADHDAMPDLEVFVQGLVASLEDLKAGRRGSRQAAFARR